ncbi:SRPBCC family protein [Chlorobaculum limnaeum]|uniref:SRPBCC family protein n=1 Tax=Chlorobaculum limnaeum TaxID=274537 RepID=UPI001969E45E|nr:SRPBCC family protein [Chlorobaculum limnaeum]
MPLILTLKPHQCKADNSRIQPSEATREYEKLIKIEITKMPDGVTGMKSTIYIDAPPAMVWKVLTDYNNLKLYIPKMVESDLVEDKGSLKVIALIGEFRVLLFKKTIRVTINMHETYPSKIDYEQISGDFEIYKGSWSLQKYSTKGTILTYVSEIKPSFVAPDFIFQGMLKKDMVAGLSALKVEAERLQAIEFGNDAGLKK